MLEYIKENHIVIITLLLGIYEVVISIIPTVSNFSALSFLMKVLRLIVPNKSKSGGVFKEVNLPADMKIKQDSEGGFEIETSKSDIQIDNKGGFIKRLKILTKNNH